MKRKTAEGQDREQEQEQEQGNPPPPSLTPVRIIHMPDSKPWRRPQRPRPIVYDVDSSGFRQLVQSLTGNSPQPPPQLLPLRPRPVLAQPQLLPLRPRPVLAQPPPPQLLPLRPRPMLAQPPLPPALMGDELGVMVWPSSQTTTVTATASTSSYASSSASAIWSPATTKGDSSYPFPGDGEQQN